MDDSQSGVPRTGGSSAVSGTNQMSSAASTTGVASEAATVGTDMQLEAEECRRRMYSLFEAFAALWVQERALVGLRDGPDTAELPCTNNAARPSNQHHHNLSGGSLAQLREVIQASVKRETAELRTEFAATCRALLETMDVATRRIDRLEASCQRLSSENLHANVWWSNANGVNQHRTAPNSTCPSTKTMKPVVPPLALGNLQRLDEAPPWIEQEPATGTSFLIEQEPTEHSATASSFVPSSLAPVSPRLSLSSRSPRHAPGPAEVRGSSCPPFSCIGDSCRRSPHSYCESCETSLSQKGISHFSLSVSSRSLARPNISNSSELHSPLALRRVFRV